MNNKWFNNLKLKSKFLAILIIPIIGTFLIFVLSIFKGNDVKHNLDELTSTQFETIKELNNLFVQAFIEGQATRNILLNTNDNTAKKNYDNAKADFNKSLNRIFELQKDHSEMLVSLNNIKSLADEVASMNERAQEMAYSGNLEEAVTFLTTQVTPRWRDLKAELFKATELEEKNYQFYRDSALNSVSTTISIIIYLGLAIIIISVFLGIKGANLLVNPILRLKTAAQNVAQGNVSVEIEVDRSDELGELSVAFNEMINHIREYNQKLIEEKNSVDRKIEEATNLANTKQKYLEAKTAELLEAMDKFSKGDLTLELEVERQDEMGRLYTGFNNAIQNIKELIRRVTESIHATASASAQISSSAEEMAAGSEEQSKQTNEVSVAIDEMTRTIYDSAKNTSLAAENAKNSGEIAKKGGVVVNKTIDEMNKIAEVVSKASETVQILGSNSEKIGEIISVISDIADQTNLLALNAAIEAARAGEQGRGFAVVADEVRKLAERTTKATKEISSMIKQIQLDTNEAVSSMTKGTSQVEKGKSLAIEAGNVLNEIVKSSEKVTDIIVQVAATSEEMSSTAEEITKRIEGINNITRENTIGIQQIAKASEDLSVLTTKLQELTEEFKIEHSSLVSRKYLR